MSLLIGGLQKTTLIDYPGKVACTVFLVGCNFRCPFCYSSELVLPEKIKKQSRVSEKEFFAFLKKRRGLLDGIVVCGGEPTIHQDLPLFLGKIKKLGFLVKLDTNGSNPKMLVILLKQKLVDYIAMDIKAPIAAKYQKAAGVKVNLEDIRRSVETIKKSGIEHEFRSTVLPKLHSQNDMVDIAKILQGAARYYLQQFRPEKTLDPGYTRLRPFKQTELEAIQKKCNHYLPTKLRS